MDVTHVGVAASDGAVNLSGEVTSFPDKRLAVKAAQRVRGVNGVADQMTVRALHGAPNDTDVAREADEAIERAVDVPVGVRVAAHDHVVTLTGVVTWDHQRVATGRAVQHLRGVRDVYNLITLSAGVATTGIRVAIGEALVRNARVDARTDTVTEGPAGTITRTGTVRSWGERRQAEQACWSAPGVLGIIDHLHLER